MTSDSLRRSIRHGPAGPDFSAPRLRPGYTEYTSEATLCDIAKNELVWTGTIKTTDPENVQTAIRSYGETVMKAFEAQNLVPAR